MHSSGFVPRLTGGTPAPLVEAPAPPPSNAELLAVWRFGLAATVFAAGAVLRIVFVLC